MTVCTTIDSPLGELLLVGEASATAHGGVALTSPSVPGQKGGAAARVGWRRDPAAFVEAVRQLHAYFAGDLECFDLEYATHGSPFRERVRQALETIPYGTTTTYGRLADRIGVPRRAVRAVGAAIGANPLLGPASLPPRHRRGRLADRLCGRS